MNYGIESWGLLTFPENNLMFSFEYHTPVEQQKVTLAIAFTVAHFVSVGLLAKSGVFSQILLKSGLAT